MIFDNFNSFYERYKNKIKKNNIDEKELKSFWIRHCSKLREIEHSRNAGIHYVDEITGIKYYSCVFKNKVFIKPSSLLNANFQSNTDIFIFCIDDTGCCGPFCG